MKGRILGCSTNKYLRFIADTGSPVAIVPRSVAIRNKLKILPPDPDEPCYVGVSGSKLSVVGQSHMFIHFKEMKTTKEVRTSVPPIPGIGIGIGIGMSGIGIGIGIGMNHQSSIGIGIGKAVLVEH